MPTTVEVACEACDRPETIVIPDHHPEGERLAWECPETAATGDQFDDNGNLIRRAGVDGCGHKNFTDGYHPAERQGSPAPAGSVLVDDGEGGHGRDVANVG